jgi:hypothetical protein
MTSELVEADFRITIGAGPDTGLRVRSQVMADKPVTIRRERIGHLAAAGHGAAQCGADIGDGLCGLAPNFTLRYPSFAKGLVTRAERHSPPLSRERSGRLHRPYAS